MSANGDCTHISLAQFIRELKGQPYLILDTETTGLQRGEIVQIAIINHQKQILLDTLVKPVGRIPADAQRIHGISDAMVADAPTWSDVRPMVLSLVEDQNLIVYNAIYDRKMMHQSAEAAELDKIEWKQRARWYCAMIAFAEMFGDWNDYHGNYRWQLLSTAAAYYDADTANAHSALGDCLMTHAVVEGLLYGRSLSDLSEEMGESGWGE